MLFNFLPALLMAPAADGQGDLMSSLMSFVPFILIIGVMYFILIRPQRKRDKADSAMRSNLEVGDMITTRGGIVGKITNIKDDLLTIETGANNVKIRIQRWAVGSKEEKISD